MDAKSLISEVVGEAYPPIVCSSPGRVRRNWIVRASGPVPGSDELKALERTLVESTSAAVSRTRAAGEKAAQGGRIGVVLARIGEARLVVRLAYPAQASGEIVAAANWGTLQRLDQEVPIADLQGLPRHHWFFLHSE